MAKLHKETPQEALWYALAVEINLHLWNGSKTGDEQITDLRDGVLKKLRQRGFDVTDTR